MTPPLPGPPRQGSGGRLPCGRSIAAREREDGGLLNYFGTGATGFVGRHLVKELLKRDGTIYVLVREGSRGKVDALIEDLGAGDRIVPVVGDLSKPELGVQGFDEKVDHLFHLAAVYDVEADDESMR